MRRPFAFLFSFPVYGLTALMAFSLLVSDAQAGRPRADHEAPGRQTFTSPQSNPIVITPDGSLVFVAATTSNRVDVIDATNNFPSLQKIDVGIEPVSLAVKPDGTELWVSNHVSDSVSVVDLVPGSQTRFTVVETIQDLDSNGVTDFDEPVGIAFKEDGSQAYVALSSRNDIAVIDTSSYAITARLHIDAQDPRALVVRNNRLYVAAFESFNQTEISACESLSDDSSCTMDAGAVGQFAVDPNLPNETKDIHVDTDAPDDDIFVFNLTTNPPTEIQRVTGVGTLLYGIAADSSNTVYVTQTDARNAENGAHGSDLVDLDNRMFLNQIAKLNCSGSCGAPTQFNLDPPVGTAPAAGDALATPFGIALSADESTMVISAAASSRIASLDTSGNVLDRLDVGAIPRGLTLKDNGDGTSTVYVLNTLDNSVSFVEMINATGALSLITDMAVVPFQPLTVGLDPTPDAVRLGRIAFNNADASDEGTFACASCHPDGNTDQLLWRIGGACPDIGCGNHDEPRSTMPVRGLRDTLPLHWDGTLGDPFGGGNGAVGTGGNGGTDCSDSNPHDCFVDLAEESLSGVMCDKTGSCPPGGNQLSAQEIDDMATFLESVSYPPARSRRIDDSLTTQAVLGFEDFFMDQGSIGGLINEPNTCADSTAGCHELPLGTGTNSSTLGAFDIPTMRGLNDRVLQFSLGLTNATELLVGGDDGFTITIAGIPFPIGTPPNTIPWNNGARGYEEDITFGAAFALFTLVYNVLPQNTLQMVEEASTGHSGAFGRQVMLNPTTTASCPACDAENILGQLEAADDRGVVNLRGKGRRNGAKVTITYLADQNLYRVGNFKPTPTLTRAALIAEAQAGTTIAVLTGHHRSGVTESTPQPLVTVEDSACGTGTGSTGDPALEVLTGSDTTMVLEAAHVTTSDIVFVDGVNYTELHSATITNLGGTPGCNSSITPNRIRVDLKSQPANGTHMLQIQTDGGLLSPEMPFVVQ